MQFSWFGVFAVSLLTSWTAEDSCFIRSSFSTVHSNQQTTSERSFHCHRIYRFHYRARADNRNTSSWCKPSASWIIRIGHGEEALGLCVGRQKSHQFCRSVNLSSNPPGLRSNGNLVFIPLPSFFPPPPQRQSPTRLSSSRPHSVVLVVQPIVEDVKQDCGELTVLHAV